MDQGGGATVTNPEGSSGKFPLVDSSLFGLTPPFKGS